jgi:thiol-disulfide isomerase/thioredoxin
LGIVPNYTTNGVLINKNNIKLIEATKQYCGGVAVTCHPHLEFFWRRAIDILLENKIKVNIHLVISDKNSIDTFEKLHKEYNGKIDYFVLLPYMNVGFAANNYKNIDFDYLEKILDKIKIYANVAFGSNFYPWLKNKGDKFNVSLYEPEILSKYIVFEQDKVRIFKNSFELKEVFNREIKIKI